MKYQIPVDLSKQLSSTEQLSFKKKRAHWTGETKIARFKIIDKIGIDCVSYSGPTAGLPMFDK